MIHCRAIVAPILLVMLSHAFAQSADFPARQPMLKAPVVRERIESQAGRVAGGTAQQLDAIVTDDIKRYRKIVQERGIKAE